MEGEFHWGRCLMDVVVCHVWRSSVETPRGLKTVMYTFFFLSKANMHILYDQNLTWLDKYVWENGWSKKLYNEKYIA